MRFSRRELNSLLLSSGAAALTGACAGGGGAVPPPGEANLSPANWPEGEYERFMAAQAVDRTSAGAARGGHGAVTVAYNGLAARAGLEALKQGGSAVDALLTSAMAQIVLTAGSPVSFFGIMSLVHYDSRTGQGQTMNADWNSVLAETEPMTIPGGVGFGSNAALAGSAASGRTALVGGFFRGVEAAHRRFGRLPFAKIFEPAIYIAEQGMPVTPLLSEQFEFRRADLARLPDTARTFLKADGSTYRIGETFRQPALAETLRQVAANGVDYIYSGPWARRLVAAVQADGGRMTLEDLERYEVLWGDPVVAPIANGYTVYTNPMPNAGGVALIEAQHLAQAAGLTQGRHWTEDGEKLRNALDICSAQFINFVPPELLGQVYPGLDFSPESRITQAHADELWRRMQAGAKLGRFAPLPPRHSDDVVAIDNDGNIAAITHTINSVFWGKTAIVVDGITIGDPASFQQASLARIAPGERMQAPTETGILFRDGRPVIGFASMGSGLHQRTFQGLLNVTAFGQDVEQAINTADFYLPIIDPATQQMTIAVPEGRFSQEVLNATGYAWRETPISEARLSGEGKWVAISRDPATGALHAASHNRNNSNAVAY